MKAFTQIITFILIISINHATHSQSVEIDGELKINVVLEDSLASSQVLMLNSNGEIGKRSTDEIGGLPSSSIIFSAIENNPALLNVGFAQIGSQISQYSSSGSGSSPYGIWSGMDQTMSAKNFHYAFWTGTEMLIQGGYSAGVLTNEGGKYDPVTDTWTPISTVNGPVPTQENTAVWTGTEMIVWGGLDANTQYITVGHKYNPTTDTWSTISTTNAPTPRFYSKSVWTGTEMIVWGGIAQQGGRQNTGARYNPTTDTWTTMSTTNAPDPRTYHEMIWTGTELIVWGGQGNGGIRYNTGGKYDPITDTWTAMSTTNAPEERGFHSSLWTGTELLVWGGSLGLSSSYEVINTGGKYNPVSDTWTSTDTTNAPTPRYYHSTIWTGNEMIVWGGVEDAGGIIKTNTGGIYDPITDSWTDTSLTNAPISTWRHSAVWTGSEMIIWGETYTGGHSSLGGIFDASGTLLFLYIKN